MSSFGARSILPRWSLPAALLVLYAGALALVWLAALDQGWRLVGDDAIIVLRANDTMSTSPPLTGMPSAFSQWSNAADPFHPGPWPLWALSPALAVFGADEGGALLATWVIAVAALVVITRISYVLGGPATAAWALVVAAVFQATLAQRPMWGPLTPAMAALPLLALCFVTWAIVRGHDRWWPGWFVIATFVAHADLSFSTGVVALGLLALVSTLRRWRRASASGAPTTPSWVWWVSAGVLVVLWSPILIDAIVDDGGNLAELWAAAGAGEPVAGPGRALYGLGHVATGEWSGGALGSPVAALALIVLVVAGATMLIRSRSWRHVALVATALVGVLGVLVGQVMTPAAAGVQSLYLLPLDAVAAFSLFAVGVVGAAGLDELTRSAPRPVRWIGAAAMVGGSVALVGAAVGSADRSPSLWYLSWSFDSIEPVSTQVGAEVPEGPVRWQPMGGFDATSVAHGVALPLLDHGVDLRVEAPLGKYYGAHRVVDGSERTVLYLTLGDGGPPGGIDALEVARWEDPDRDATAEQAVRRRAATAVRTAGAAFTPQASSFAVGTAAVGAGAAVDPGSGGVLSDDVVIAFGQELLDDPRRVEALSDDAIGALLHQGLLEAPPGVDRWQTGLGGGSVIKVWSATIPEGA